jgi:hypothetical protein
MPGTHERAWERQSKVVRAYHPEATTGWTTVNQGPVDLMVHAAVRVLTGIGETAAAWRSLFPGITAAHTVGFDLTRTSTIQHPYNYTSQHHPSRILGQLCDYMINASVIKDHNEAGVGTIKINQERALHSLSPLNPSHVYSSALPPHNLGTDDPAQIDLVEIDASQTQSVAGPSGPAGGLLHLSSTPPAPWSASSRPGGARVDPTVWRGTVVMRSGGPPQWDLFLPAAQREEPEATARRLAQVTRPRDGR